MNKLRFFDCNASFGRRKFILPGSFYSKEDLLKNMDYYNIKQALVSHAFARELDPTTGNKMLENEIKGENCFSPCWVVMPHHTNEFPSPENLIGPMKSADVKAVTMYPGTGNYFFSLSEWNCGKLYSFLEEHGIPLILPMSELDDQLITLHDILQAHPRIKIILTNVLYSIARSLYPLMKKFPGLYLETSGFKTQDGIHDVCDVFGASKLIFGSNMPISSGASAIYMVLYAGISLADKERIAYENLNELLGGVLL